MGDLLQFTRKNKDGQVVSDSVKKTATEIRNLLDNSPSGVISILIRLDRKDSFYNLEYNTAYLGENGEIILDIENSKGNYGYNYSSAINLLEEVLEVREFNFIENNLSTPLTQEEIRKEYFRELSIG